MLLIVTAVKGARFKDPLRPGVSYRYSPPLLLSSGVKVKLSPGLPVVVDEEVLKKNSSLFDINPYCYTVVPAAKTGTSNIPVEATVIEVSPVEEIPTELPSETPPEDSHKKKSGRKKKNELSEDEVLLEKMIKENLGE